MESSIVLALVKIHSVGGAICLLIHVVRLISTRKWSGIGVLIRLAGLYIAPAFVFVLSLLVVCSSTDCLHGSRDESSGGLLGLVLLCAVPAPALLFWYIHGRLLYAAVRNNR